MHRNKAKNIKDIDTVLDYRKNMSICQRKLSR